jgi:hypothetical protein
MIHGESKFSQDPGFFKRILILNFKIFRAEWESKLMKLLESVNKSVDVVDFLDRSQEEILREIAKCIQASQDREAKKLDEELV